MKATESRDATSAQHSSSQVANRVGFLGDAKTLVFKQVRENKPEIWEQALECTGTVEQRGRPDLFLIWEKESEDFPENCSLSERYDSSYLGWCSCDQFASEGVCQHLCLLRQKSVVSAISIPSETG